MTHEIMTTYKTRLLTYLLSLGEDTGGFTNSLSTDFSPWDLSGISAGKELDLGSSNVKTVTFDGHVSRVSTVDRVVLELISGVVDVKERVVDSNNGGIRVLKSGTADKTTDTSKSVDSKADRHDEK